jgi:hypothetical protein
MGVRVCSPKTENASSLVQFRRADVSSMPKSSCLSNGKEIKQRADSQAKDIPYRRRDKRIDMVE